MIRPVPFSWIVILFLFDKLVQAAINAPWFVRNYLDDILLIPLVMGASLFLQQKFVSANFTYKWTAILGSFLFFTLTFEWLAPQFLASYTQDYYDALAYAAGALFFYLFQNHPTEFSKN